MWVVEITNNASRQLKKLPLQIKNKLQKLIKEIESEGPIRTNWNNFGRLKLGPNIKRYHCHLKSGRPTYVVCWIVKNKKIKLVEIYYVGTHEKAPY